MKHLVVLLSLFVAATASKADFVKLKGAEKRKHYAEQNQLDVDDVIRAEEDPNFSQYLKERERQKRADTIARLKFDEQQRAEEEAYERARIEYISHESGNTASDDMKKYQLYLRDKRAYKLQQEKYRRDYANAQQAKEAKLRSERVARVHQFISAERMPASQ